MSLILFGRTWINHPIQRDLSYNYTKRLERKKKYIKQKKKKYSELTLLWGIVSEGSSYISNENKKINR